MKRISATLMYTTISCFLMLTQLSAKETSVYKWVDENGVVVYSDKPKEGAKQIKVSPSVSVMAPIDTSVLSRRDQSEIKPTGYEVKLLSPADQSTIRDNSGNLRVVGSYSPKSKTPLQFQVEVDGVKYGKPQSSGQFSLQNIDRGEHTIRLLLLSNKGEVLASSDAATIYVHRRTLLNPRP